MIEKARPCGALFCFAMLRTSGLTDIGDAESMPVFSMQQIMPIVLLVASNVFMTFAWYGHLKFTDRPLWLVIVVSWGIAFFEYCLAVPANRIGHQAYSTAELKTMQEVITFAVFMVFSVFFLKEAITLKHVFGFSLIALGAAVVFKA
jgi:uncharacterized protein